VPITITRRAAHALARVSELHGLTIRQGRCLASPVLVEVELEESRLARLRAYRRRGESISQTIERLARSGGGRFELDP
jgi:hypothetical protein